MELLLTNTQGKAFVVNANDTTVPYQRVEYLENTNSAQHMFVYQNPQAGAFSSFDFEIRLRFSVLPTNGYIGSGITSSGGAQFFVACNSASATGIYMCFAPSSSGTLAKQLANSDKNGWHTYRAVSDGTTCTYYVDGEQVFQHNNAVVNLGTTKMLLFRMANDQAFAGKQQISHFKFSRNGELVRDLIPVRVDNAGYMYDKVSGQLFSNAGTGDFVIGPDMPSAAVTIANDYVTNGLTHWWDGICKGGVNGVWKDLIGDIDLTAQGNITSSHLSWILSGGYLLSANEKYISEDYTPATIEAVFRVDSISSGKTVFVFVSGPNTTEKPILAIDTNNNVILGDKKSRPTYKITDWKGKPQRISLTHGNGLINCATPTAGSSTYKNNNNYYTYVGRRSSSYTDNSTFIGEVYCIRVYNRNLTTAEMLHNQLVDEFRFGLWDRQIVQLVQNGDFSDGVTGWSAGYRCSRSVSDGVMTVKKNTSTGHIVARNDIQLSAYHKYFFHYEAKLNTTTTGNICVGMIGDPSGKIGDAFDKSVLSDWTTITLVASSGTSAKSYLQAGAYANTNADYLAVGDTIEMRNIYLIDLTLTFGEGNEPDINLCRKIFTKSYYPYYNPNE